MLESKHSHHIFPHPAHTSYRYIFYTYTVLICMLWPPPSTMYPVHFYPILDLFEYLDTAIQYCMYVLIASQFATPLILPYIFLLYFVLLSILRVVVSQAKFVQIIKDLHQQTSNNFDESLLFRFENSREAALHNAIVLEYYNFNINDAINQTLRTLPISKSFCKITLIGVYSTKYLGKEQLSPSTRFWMILGYKIFCFIRKEATTNQQRQIMMH